MPVPALTRSRPLGCVQVTKKTPRNLGPKLRGSSTGQSVRNKVDTDARVTRAGSRRRSCMGVPSSAGRRPPRGAAHSIGFYLLTRVTVPVLVLVLAWGALAALVLTGRLRGVMG